MKKNKFTIIELIIVIAILAILASIIVPNVSNIKNEASVVASYADLKSIQTAVDMYSVKNRSSLPVVGDEQPVLANPKPINFDKLYPEFLRKKPNPKFNYWVDSYSIAWMSSIDAPDVELTSGTLSWTGEANEYFVYQTDLNSGKSNSKVKLISKTKNKSISNIDINYTYLVQGEDKNGLKTPMVGVDYITYNNPSLPSDLDLNGKNPNEEVKNPEEIKDYFLIDKIKVKADATYEVIPISGWFTDETTTDYIVSGFSETSEMYIAKENKKTFEQVKLFTSPSEILYYGIHNDKMYVRIENMSNGGIGEIYSVDINTLETSKISNTNIFAIGVIGDKLYAAIEEKANYLSIYEFNLNMDESSKRFVSDVVPSGKTLPVELPIVNREGINYLIYPKENDLYNLNLSNGNSSMEFENFGDRDDMYLMVGEMDSNLVHTEKLDRSLPYPLREISYDIRTKETFIVTGFIGPNSRMNDKILYLHSSSYSGGSTPAIYDLKSNEVKILDYVR